MGLFSSLFNISKGITGVASNIVEEIPVVGDATRIVREDVVSPIVEHGVEPVVELADEVIESVFDIFR